MNLIEQLGGYEKAKKLVGDCKRYGRSDVRAPVNGGFIHVVADFLELDLLEHRRQHNIFEVGDKVLEIGDDCEMSILTVNSISSKMMVCVNDGLDAFYCLSKYSPSFYVRHATPEEIAAGCRL